MTSGGEYYGDKSSRQRGEGVVKSYNFKSIDEKGLCEKMSDIWAQAQRKVERETYATLGGEHSRQE